MEGYLAYVTAFQTLRVIDVFNPTAPAQIGAIGTPGRAYDVDVTGDLPT